MSHNTEVPEKRRSKRYPRRLKVRFGENDFSLGAMTADISAGGAFIIFAKPFPIGKRLHMQIQIDNTDKYIYYEAKVRRLKLIPPELRQIERNGFGVEFMLPADLMMELLPQMASSPRLVVSFNDEAELSRIFEKEIKAGGLFVKTDKRFNRDQEIVVEVRLDFVQKNFEFPASVIHVQDVGVRGVGVAFDDPPKVLSALVPYVR